METAIWKLEDGKEIQVWLGESMFGDPAILADRNGNCEFPYVLGWFSKMLFLAGGLEETDIPTSEADGTPKFVSEFPSGCMATHPVGSPLYWEKKGVWLTLATNGQGDLYLMACDKEGKLYTTAHLIQFREDGLALCSDVSFPNDKDVTWESPMGKILRIFDYSGEQAAAPNYPDEHEEKMRKELKDIEAAGDPISSLLASILLS